MTQVDELEIKLYQLLKEDNWSDESATQAVNAVKSLQREANKYLATKTDSADLKVDLIKWMVGIAFTAVSVLSAVIFGLIRFFSQVHFVRH